MACRKTETNALPDGFDPTIIDYSELDRQGRVHHRQPVQRIAEREVPRVAPPPPPSVEHVAYDISPFLDAAYPSTLVDVPAAQRLLSSLAAAHDPLLERALVFALARRAPPELLAQVRTHVTPALVETFARALAGRPRESVPPEVLAGLWPAPPETDAARDLAAAIGRLSLRLPAPVAVDAMLTAPSWQAQMTGARLLSSPSAVIPEGAVLGAAASFAVTAAVRALGSRPETPVSVWQFLVPMVAGRARAAPRIWGNTWRAVRDTAPIETVPELVEPFLAAVDDADLAVSKLPSETGGHWRCENAEARDIALGRGPSSSQRCAPAGLEWRSLVAQLRVVQHWTAGAAGDRVARVAGVVRHALANQQVFEAAAEALGELPPPNARTVWQRLASERDPGVMAAVLGQLVLHVQHARLLPRPALDALLQAPFTLPEASSVEARVSALRLAAALGLPSPVATDAALPVSRAVRLALDPMAAPSSERIQIPPGAHPEAYEIRTDAGPMIIELRPDISPTAVAAVLHQVELGGYVGLNFHRVLPGFVAQGGDPRGDGYGGADTVLPTELSLQPFDRGAIGIPLAGLDTGGTQLFFVTADAPHLDGRYPWVGRVVRGMEVLDGLLPGDRILQFERAPH